MKMTMVKYLFPIILALTAPAAAQNCATPDSVTKFAAQAEYSLIAQRKDFTDYAGHWDEFRAYEKDGETILLWFQDGCVADENDLPSDKAEGYLNSIGINKAAE